MRATSCSTSSRRAAPVSVRNASSSVGWRSPRSSTHDVLARPAPRPARAIASTPPSAGAVHGAVVDRRPAAPAKRSTICADRRSTSARRRRTTTCSWSPPTWRLRLRASPRAITRPWSTTTMSSARRSASSRYCVVSSIVAPLVDEVLEHVPEVVAGARVQAGRRLVEEQQLGRRRRASRRGRAGGACRPSTPWRAGRAASASANCSSSSSARVRARLRPRWCSSPIIVRFSCPVSRPSTVASWAARPMLRRTSTGSVAMSWPATRARARVGLGQRREDAHRGRLARAVGAEQRAHRAARRRRGRRRPARSCRRSA